MISGDLKSQTINLISDGNSRGLRNPRPVYLLGNLIKKRVGIPHINIKTNSIPKFVPEIAPPEASTITTNATTTNLKYNNFVFPNLFAPECTNYQITIRNKDGSTAALGFVKFVSQTGDPAPNSGGNFNVFSNSIIEKPYFYLYDFTSFLKMVADSMDETIKLLETGTIPPVSFYYDNPSKSYELYIPKVITDKYHIEFNEELHTLFDFSSSTEQINKIQIGSVEYYQKTQRLIIPPVEYSIDTNMYYKTTTNENNEMFPFDYFILHSPEIPVMSHPFTNSNDTNNVYNKEYNSLYVWSKKQFNAITLPKNYFVETKELGFKLTSFNPEQQTSSQYDRNYVDFYLTLKTKNGRFIDWLFPEGECINFQLNLYDIY